MQEAPYWEGMHHLLVWELLHWCRRCCTVLCEYTPSTLTGSRDILTKGPPAVMECNMHINV